jgi:hypothetical protein
MLLLLLFGLLLLRFATRTLFQLLFQPPPRNTLFSACPHAAANSVLTFALLPLCALALILSFHSLSCASSRR